MSDDDDDVRKPISNPTSLRQMESVVTFKRHLKTKLFRDAYSLSE